MERKENMWRGGGVVGREDWSEDQGRGADMALMIALYKSALVYPTFCSEGPARENGLWMVTSPHAIVEFMLSTDGTCLANWSVSVIGGWCF